jgi:hypothetical protein
VSVAQNIWMGIRTMSTFYQIMIVLHLTYLWHLINHSLLLI